LVTSTRPVVLSCLDFIRMFMSAVHSQRLPFYLKRLIESLSGMDEEHKSAYRNRTRDILSRMMRKCGADSVIMMVPQDDDVLLKRLKNLKKIEARKKKDKEQGRKNDNDEEEDETMATQPKTMEHVLADSDDDDDMNEEDVKDSRKRSLKTWIQEDESSIVDFLDPAAAKKVTATNPRSLSSAVAAKKKKSEGIFKTAPDGRLIIKDCSDSESSDQSDEGDISQAFDNLQMDQAKEQTTGRKRKIDDDDMEEDEPSFKYQAGGSGIHRPIAKDQTRSGVKKLTAKKRAQESVTKSKPVDYGAEYRSTKAHGDVKRKGRPDPFAYIPLSKSVLNKRNRAKAAGQFKGLVGSGRRAGKTGSHVKDMVSSARKEALAGQLALARKGAQVRSKSDSKTAKS